MSLLRSLFGKGRVAEKRRHRRATGSGVRVRVDSHSYRVHDLSLSGFRLYPYDGDLIVRQHFAFTFVITVDGETYEIPGHGNVVRIDAGGLAATYERPQPYFRKLLERHIEAPESG